jgi:uncharacterized protein YbgA (DUF1722 family)/uncharacterized protein YbbK (DUF523 family)
LNSTGKLGVEILRTFVTPNVVVSRCIEFDAVRYNGQMIASDFVKQLKPHVDFITVCPEVEIGLGIPREGLRIVLIEGKKRLIQPATKLDFTEKMELWADAFLNSLPEVDGFILKSRSPSSGLRGSKVYPEGEKVASIGRSSGLFGGKVLERFSDLAIEEEDRLRNSRIREHFLTKLFALADFRKAKSSNSMEELVRFHSENKLLLKAYNQKTLGVMGRTVANQQKKPFANIVRDYQRDLADVLRRPPRTGSNIDVLLHGMGYFSRKLSKGEKALFLKYLERYKAGKIPLGVATGVLRSWIVRFEEPYLMNQSFFEPYPEEMRENAATFGKDKDY